MSFITNLLGRASAAEADPFEAEVQKTAEQVVVPPLSGASVDSFIEKTETALAALDKRAESLSNEIGRLQQALKETEVVSEAQRAALKVLRAPAFVSASPSPFERNARKEAATAQREAIAKTRDHPFRAPPAPSFPVPTRTVSTPEERKANSDRVTNERTLIRSKADILADVRAAEERERDEYLDTRTDEQRASKYPNGLAMFAMDGTLLDDKGNRSIFDDVDK